MSDRYALEQMVSREETARAVRAVGHDVRNQLAVMRNSTYYLRMRVGTESDKVTRHLEIIERAIAHTSEEILDLMDYVLPRSSAPVRVLLSELAQGFLQSWGIEYDVAQCDEGDDVCGWVDHEQTSRALQCLAEALRRRHLECLRCIVSVRDACGVIHCELSHPFSPSLAAAEDDGNRFGVYLQECLVITLLSLNAIFLDVGSESTVLELRIPLSVP